MATEPERWIDRAALRLTRRESLKRAAIAGAAFSLPMVALPSRAAAAEGDCVKGCYWTANKKWESNASVCDFQHYAAIFRASAGGGVGLVVELLTAGSIASCYDKANLLHHIDVLKCEQPGCGGFNPFNPGGPCDDCQAYCNPCSTVNTGYICCVYPAGDPSHNCCPS